MDGLVSGVDYLLLVQEAVGSWLEGWSQKCALLEGASTFPFRPCSKFESLCNH